MAKSGTCKKCKAPKADEENANSYGWFIVPIVVIIHLYQWIGLRENLQETIDFPMKYGVFL